MNKNRLQNRNSTLDIIRIVAVFTVCSVHFFLHNGFYSEAVSGMGPIEGLISFFSTGDKAALHGPLMFLMVMMRTFFGVCVPLFMILTGWLMSKKELSRSYYKGIRKTLIIFVLASIVCMAFKSIHNTPVAYDAFYKGDFSRMFEAIKETNQYDFKHYLLSIFDFTGANYSWYIEMYIGLFLIAPFLNLAFHKLKTKKQRQVLVLTFIALSTLPTVFNVFNFDTLTWWTTPSENTTYQKLIPAFWMGIYPITYYFSGMYLREYGLKLKTKTLAALLFISLFLFTAFNWFRSEGGGFVTSVYGYWYGIHPYVLGVLFFTLLSRIKTDSFSLTAKTVLWRISDLALGAYLMSYVSDEIVYKALRENVSVMVDRLPYYFITVPVSFIAATAMSYILNKVHDLIIFLYEKIKSFVIRQREKENGLFWQDILFIILMVGTFIFALWKCSYGFGGNDEAFYLTIPHRLTLGDALFSDEWHLSQLSSFLLLPFTWIYTAATGSTEGILLAARIFYLFVHAAATLIIYKCLRKYGYIAMFGTVLYFIFTPYNIMALSYDSMGLELVILTGVLLGTAKYEKKLQIIFAGVCYFGAVLCNPYLAVGYFIYALCMVVHLIIKKKELNFALKSEMFSLRTFLFFTLGAAILGIVFLIFTLTRVSIPEIFTNLPYMMKDPEHPSIPLLKKIGSYFTSIYNCHPMFKYALYAYGATLIALIFDRQRRYHRAIYLIISAVLSAYTLILFLASLSTSTYNHIMFAPIFITITAYILCDKKPKELFVGLFCFGVLYSVCIHCTSNQYFYIISVALTAANLAGFVFLSTLIKEMKERDDTLTYARWEKWLSFALVTMFIFHQGIFEISAKATHVFWENPIEELTEEITMGPAKGIKTTSYKLSQYNAVYSDLSVYRNKEKGNILFMTERTWTYLAADGYPYGTYSAWLSGENDYTVERLKEFYALNPEKVPKYIYIPKDSKWDINALVSELIADGYAVSESVNAYMLEK